MNEEKKIHEKKHQDELLEEGLRESFPASDPPSVFTPKDKKIPPKTNE